MNRETGMISDADLGVLLDFTSLVQASLSTGRSFRPLFGLLSRIVPYETATLYLLDETSGKLRCEEVVGEEPINPIDVIRFDLGFGLSAWIAQQRRPIIIPWLRRKRANSRHRMHSFVGLPLVADDELLGVLNFGHSSPGAFQYVDDNPLRILSTQIALLLQNLRLVRSLRDTNSRLNESNLRLREMQDRLVESERLKAVSELVAAMNHEINNPLTIISGNAELLAACLQSEGEEAQERLRTILDQVRRLGRVLNLLANLRRPVAENYTTEHLMLDLRASCLPPAGREASEPDSRT